MEFGKTRNRILLALLFIIFLPWLQQAFSFVESGKLNGAITDAPNVDFTWKGWWDGSYQQKKNAYLNDSFGFRPDLVRFHNQLNFWLFKKLYADKVVIGTHNVFYEKSYIDEYCGTGYEGDSIAREKLTKLKAIQDTLTRLGKTFVLVYAPSKAYYFPNNFPEDLQCAPTQMSNYHAFRRIGDSLHLNQIDCNGWFVSMRDKAGGMVMSKSGIHWTYFGAIIAADSIIRYIDKARNIDMPMLKWNKIDVGEGLSQELDILQATNLIFPVIHELYSHPEIIPDTGVNKVKPKTIFLGDSYLWTFAYNNVMKTCSTDWEFWYYNNDVWTQNVFDGKEQLKHINNYDWFQSLMQRDCIIMMYTEPNLWNLGNGFIEDTYAKFYPNKK
jgi:hypothetical protein